MFGYLLYGYLPLDVLVRSGQIILPGQPLPQRRSSPRPMTSWGARIEARRTAEEDKYSEPDNSWRVVSTQIYLQVHCSMCIGWMSMTGQSRSRLCLKLDFLTG